MEHIPNEDLEEPMLPAPFADWKLISPFAFSFHAYEYYGDFGKCAQLANGAVKSFKGNNSLPQTLTELRVCLFFEQRRKVHQSVDFDEEKMRYIHALVEAIRGKVKSKKFKF